MNTHRVLLSAASPQFDPVTIRNWREEGFTISYLPHSGNRKTYAQNLMSITDDLEFGDSVALIAYGAAAGAALEAFMKPMPKFCTLVCYYPDSFPSTLTGLPPNLDVLLHLAANQRQAPRYPNYTYPDCSAGFAEVDSPTYDKLSANIAWTRTLNVVRKGFDVEVDLEDAWEKHLALEFGAKDVDKTMETMVDEPYVNHVPTLTGGIGYAELHRFYKDFFIPNNPPSMRMKLVSRTIGTNQIVDEMYMSFRHTHVIPWILPNVEPTNKNVEIALVSVVRIRGGKLCHEHIYFDQASVLAQVGLIDPKVLPVVGAAGARKVLDETSEPSNELIENW